MYLCIDQYPHSKAERKAHVHVCILYIHHTFIRHAKKESWVSFINKLFCEALARLRRWDVGTFPTKFRTPCHFFPIPFSDSVFSLVFSPHLLRLPQHTQASQWHSFPLLHSQYLFFHSVSSLFVFWWFIRPVKKKIHWIQAIETERKLNQFSIFKQHKPKKGKCYRQK